jgi:crotonobetainyl-CoA hydratase
VVPAAELDVALQGWLKDLRRASPLVMRLNTRTLKRVSGAEFATRLDLAERIFLEELMTSEDPVEGIEAFYAKRRPEWKNR